MTENVKPQFLPCPFCDCAHIAIQYHQMADIYSAHCDLLEGGCGATIGGRESVEVLAEDWNTRPDCDPDIQPDGYLLHFREVRRSSTRSVTQCSLESKLPLILSDEPDVISRELLSSKPLYDLIRLRANVASYVQQIKFLQAELEEQRVKKFARFNNEDCWIYQGDGDDHLESLVCPVVISPAELLRLLNAAGEKR